MKKLYILIALIVMTTAQSQIINIPDPVLKANLLTSDPFSSPVAFDQNDEYIVIDANGDNEIDQLEALAVYRMNLGVLGATDITGLEHFTNLRSLNIYGNNIATWNLTALTNLLNFSCHFSTIQNAEFAPAIEEISLISNQVSAIDLTNYPNLKTFRCSYNQLTSLDVSNNPLLTMLECDHNSIMSIDFGNIMAIERLNVSYNQLNELDVANMTNMSSLDCSENNLSVLDISQLASLEIVYCSFNQISELDIAGKAHLLAIYCNNNSIQSLDFTGVGSETGNVLSTVECSFNNISALDFTVMGEKPLHVKCGANPSLTTISIKNGTVFTDQAGFRTSGPMLPTVPPPLPMPGIYFPECPNLQYICTDEFNIAYVQARINNYGFSQCVVNSYCNFVPGENYFVIEGNVKSDFNSDGCDAADTGIPWAKLQISDGTEIRTFFSAQNGDYILAAFEGTHMISPILENPELFVVTPASATFTFPDDATPSLQDFCISPNGTHPNLEINIIPMSAARPGFDAHYKISIRNKGNQVQSGSFTFAFPEDLADVVSTNPAAAMSPGVLSWTFSSLLPYEIRDYFAVLNINSPMEIPPVNADDILLIEAVVDNGADDHPEDNTATLRQTVVNSVDPNDKTCLEGDIVSIDKVGDFVHYLIRFENTGTFDAQNVVVTDVIDAARFDVNSLVPISASHPMQARIVAGNRAEFLFENIELSFDDANNDGHVAFKIKTLPTLVADDTFSNTAEIYFDFNFPVVTNTASTTIALLTTTEVSDSGFSIYPNPAEDELNIASDHEVKSIEIYDLTGKIVMTKSDLHPNRQLNIGSLSAGTYLIKVTSDKGSTVQKLIKH